MNVKTCLLFLLCFSIIISVHAQDKETEKVQNQRSNFVSIGFTPLALLEPITSTLEGVVSWKFTPHWSIDAKYGIPLGYSMLRHNHRDDDRYQEYKFGVKYHLYDSPDARSIAFIGIEYFVVDQRFHTLNDWMRRESTVYTFNRSDIHRTVKGTRIIAGAHSTFAKHFVIEFYTGIGRRVVTIDHNMTNPIAQPSPNELGQYYYGEDEWITPFWREEEKRFRFDFVTGLTLSYKFFKY